MEVTHVTSALIPLVRTRDMPIPRGTEGWKMHSGPGNCFPITNLYIIRGRIEFYGHLAAWTI